MAGTKVFISYSHDDNQWRRRVCKHLGVLEREGLIELWDDQKLQAGEDWLSRLYQKMLEARIAVLLISDSFLTSEFSINEEVRVLFEQCEKEGGMIIYPLLIRPCAWQEVSWLARKQIRPIMDAQPRAVSSFRGAKRDEVIASIAREIAAIARAHDPSPPEAKLTVEISAEQREISSAGLLCLDRLQKMQMAIEEGKEQVFQEEKYHLGADTDRYWRAVSKRPPVDEVELSLSSRMREILMKDIPRAELQQHLHNLISDLKSKSASAS